MRSRRGGKRYTKDSSDKPRPRPRPRRGEKVEKIGGSRPTATAKRGNEKSTNRDRLGNGEARRRKKGAAAAQTDHLAARSVFLKGEEEELAKKHALLGFALTQLQKNNTSSSSGKRKKDEKIRDGGCDRDVERRRRENGLPKFAHLCFERVKCFLMNFPPVSKGRRFSNLAVTLMEP